MSDARSLAPSLSDAPPSDPSDAPAPPFRPAHYPHQPHTPNDARPAAPPAVAMQRLRLDANLVASHAGLFRQMVSDALHTGARHLVVDLTHCAYVDARGLGALVSATRAADSVGGSLVIEGANEDLQTLFAITRLDTILNLGSA